MKKISIVGTFCFILFVSCLFAGQKISVNQIVNFTNAVNNTVASNTNFPSLTITSTNNWLGKNNFSNTVTITEPITTNSPTTIKWVTTYISTNYGILLDGSIITNIWVGPTNIIYIIDPSHTYTNKIGTFSP